MNKLAIPKGTQSKLIYLVFYNILPNVLVLAVHVYVGKLLYR